MVSIFRDDPVPVFDQTFCWCCLLCEVERWCHSWWTDSGARCRCFSRVESIFHGPTLARSRIPHLTLTSIAHRGTCLDLAFAGHDAHAIMYGPMTNESIFGVACCPATLLNSPHCTRVKYLRCNRTILQKRVNELETRLRKYEPSTSVTHLDASVVLEMDATTYSRNRCAAVEQHCLSYRVYICEHSVNCCNMQWPGSIHMPVIHQSPSRTFLCRT